MRYAAVGVWRRPSYTWSRIMTHRYTYNRGQRDRDDLCALTVYTTEFEKRNVVTGRFYSRLEERIELSRYFRGGRPAHDRHHAFEQRSTANDLLFSFYLFIFFFVTHARA